MSPVEKASESEMAAFCSIIGSRNWAGIQHLERHPRIADDLLREDGIGILSLTSRPVLADPTILDVGSRMGSVLSRAADVVACALSEWNRTASSGRGFDLHCDR